MRLKNILLLLAMLTALLLYSCKPLPLQSESQPLQNITPEPLSEEPQEQPLVQNVSSQPIPIQEKPVKNTTPASKEEPSKYLSPFKDPFVGQTINTERYSQIINGTGKIKQDDVLIMTGTAKNSIVWETLYTTQQVDISKSFTFSVNVDLKASVEEGDAMAMIGVESRNPSILSKEPIVGHCELTTLGPRIRTDDHSAGHHSRIQDDERVSTTTGKLTLSYDVKTSMLGCNFDGKSITLKIPKPKNDMVLTLRAGLHTITHGGTEMPGTGTFTITFDDVHFKLQN